MSETENNNNNFTFICYNCHHDNTLNRRIYIDKNEEYFLEAEGNIPTKEVVISCYYCKTKNKINIPYF